MIFVDINGSTYNYLVIEIFNAYLIIKISHATGGGGGGGGGDLNA